MNGLKVYFGAILAICVNGVWIFYVVRVLCELIARAIGHVAHLTCTLEEMGRDTSLDHEVPDLNTKDEPVYV